MPKDDIFSSSMKYSGIFNFKDFYQFCFRWLTDEMQLQVSENEYEEKLNGNSKDIKFKWAGNRKVSEYFNYEVKIEFEITGLTEIEIVQNGDKIKTNRGNLKVKIKGILVKDPKGQFETTPQMKMFRGIYEKFIIPSRLKQYEDKLINGCDEFLSQAKAFLDLEGRK